jgi:hypothetical protein
MQGVWRFSRRMFKPSVDIVRSHFSEPSTFRSGFSLVPQWSGVPHLFETVWIVFICGSATPWSVRQDILRHFLNSRFSHVCVREHLLFPYESHRWSFYPIFFASFPLPVPLYFHVSSTFFTYYFLRKNCTSYKSLIHLQLYNYWGMLCWFSSSHLRSAREKFVSWSKPAVQM